MSNANAANQQGQGTGGAGANDSSTASGTGAAANTNPNQQAGGKTVEQLQAEFDAFRKQSNEENKRHREKAEKVAAEFEAQKHALASALGLSPEGTKGKSGGDPTDALKAAEERNRTFLLRAEFVAEAAKAGCVDAADAFHLARSMLRDVNVDLAGETVDRTALAAKVAELKSSKPYLFGSASSSNGSGNTNTPPARMPDGSGRPNSDGGTAYEKWQRMVSAGDRDPVQRAAANKFYAQHKAEISATWPRG